MVILIFIYDRSKEQTSKPTAISPLSQGNNNQGEVHWVASHPPFWLTCLLKQFNMQLMSMLSVISCAASKSTQFEGSVVNVNNLM